MALIKCPECGNQISDKAEICPHCGIEVQKVLLEIREKQRIQRKKRRKCIIISTVSVCVVAIIAVSAYLYSIDALNTIPAEAQIKQRVEQMMKMHELDDADKMLTTELYNLQTKAQSVHLWADIFPGFQWDLAIQDACSENRGAKIEGVTPVDSLHCDVAMHYVDSTCYEFPYTLKLLKENGEWKIDDVLYNETSLSQDCKDFYEDVVDTYSTEDPKDIMEFLMSEEPIEANYTDPESIYYNNPESVKGLIETIKNCQELFKKNPGYTEEMEKQIDEMIKRIESHIQ